MRVFVVSIGVATEAGDWRIGIWQLERFVDRVVEGQGDEGLRDQCHSVEVVGGHVVVG